MHIYGIEKNGIDELICKAEIETQTGGQTFGYQGGTGRWNGLEDWD